MNYIVTYDRDIILNKTTEKISEEDFNLLKHLSNDEVYTDITFDLCCMNLSSIEKLPENFYTKTLREYFAEKSEEEDFIAFRGKGITEWRKNTKFCNVCGSKLIEHKTMTAMECPDCHNLFFPKISPCIIVAVQKEEKLLLARHKNRNQDIYACIAGFMETGESAEQAVAREVFEETGLKIKNITYRGSQSWPFPNQLMLGFTADYESGEIKIQEEEISDAQWFNPDNCPASPKPGSIAYRLIHKLY